ncbi:hypothetical protein AGMMS49975_17520 [Clostridia bacterium]|nr:hypothetical protein AGMMS49975_17520 [Clostridia bacterium]
MTISAEGYETVNVYGVSVFDTETTDLPVTMHHEGGGYTRDIENAGDTDINNIYIGDNALRSSTPRNAEGGGSGTRVLKDVIIPYNITVHLGRPDREATNVTVPFIDYVKNTASHEIYPTWPEASLEANIDAITTFALNRIYTEWYRGAGKNFDISNSTAFDQYYVQGGEVFKSISDVVDRVFATYIQRQGYKDPYFSQFCNGTTSTCNGMSQWGTVPLAEAGYTPLQILKYYYPNDITLVKATKYSDIYTSYPGYTMSNGMNSNDIKTMQQYLNRIATNFPLIKSITNPNGYFGADTVAAVKAFQQSFNLTPTGVIDKGTWDKISQIYVAVKRLGELDGEGERVDIGANPPTSVIKAGAKGNDVVELQFILNYLSQFYDEIPPVLENGIVDAATVNSIKEFQKLKGLTQDGIVGPATWRVLYDAYKSAKGGGGGGSTPQYPGYYLKVGVKDDNVRTMQTYLNALSSKYPSIPKLTADGDFGNQTKAAVIEFQKLFGLTADGIIGKSTWDAIVKAAGGQAPSEDQSYPGYYLKVGVEGEKVRQLQRYLNAISSEYPSIPKITADGAYGNATAAAVKKYQQLFGLTADGITGQATWDSVVSTYNKLGYTSYTSGITTGADSSYGTIENGASGDGVRQLQQYLNAISVYYPTIPKVTVDGIYGNATESAVKKYQQLSGLTADGIAGAATWNSVVSSYNNLSSRSGGDTSLGTTYFGAIENGSDGDNVRQLQQYLNAISAYYPSIPKVSVDGIFGIGTENAVKRYQQLFGLSVDGVVGNNTWSSIVSTYNSIGGGNNIAQNLSKALISRMLLNI